MSSAPEAGDTPPAYPSMWHAVLSFLRNAGAPAVFGLPDDDMGLLVAAADGPDDQPRILVCRDQRNAAYMAIGTAQTSGRLGVCVIGKGPAATNVTTALLEADTGRVPLLVLATGTSADRQATGAFQEADQLSALAPLTKHAIRVGHPSRVQDALERAALIALHDRPGPVYVELPADLAAGPVPVARPWRELRTQRPAPDAEAVARSLALLRACRRPLVLAGGGARGLERTALVDRFADSIGAGVFVTASGRGSVSEQFPRFLGVAGLYASAQTADLWASSDLLVTLGSRLEETATFGWPEPAPPLLQVNLAAGDVAVRFEGEHVLGDAASTVRAWLAADLTPAADPPGRPEWSRAVIKSRSQSMAAARTRRVEQGAQSGLLHVADVLQAMHDLLPEDVVLVQENGLQDMWSYFYPYWSFSARGLSVVPSEQAPLCFGAAAAVGVQTGTQGRPVVALVGDGAFNLFRSELPTLIDHQVPVLYVVLDNGGYGWLEQNLRARLGSGSRFSFARPRRTGNAALAEALGIAFTSAHNRNGLAPALAEAWKECEAGRPSICEITVRLEDAPPGLDELAGDFPSPAPDPS